MTLAGLSTELPGPWAGGGMKTTLEGLEDAGCLINPLRDLRRCVDDREVESLESAEGASVDAGSLDAKERTRKPQGASPSRRPALPGLLCRPGEPPQYRLRLSVDGPLTSPPWRSWPSFDFRRPSADSLTACPVGDARRILFRGPSPRRLPLRSVHATTWPKSGCSTGRRPFPLRRGARGLTEQIDLLQGELLAKRRHASFRPESPHQGGRGAIRPRRGGIPLLPWRTPSRPDRASQAGPTASASREAREEANLDEIRRRWDESRGPAELPRPLGGSTVDDMISPCALSRDRMPMRIGPRTSSSFSGGGAPPPLPQGLVLQEKHPTPIRLLRRLILGDALRRKEGVPVHGGLRGRRWSDRPFSAGLAAWLVTVRDLPGSRFSSRPMTEASSRRSGSNPRLPRIVTFPRNGHRRPTTGRSTPSSFISTRPRRRRSPRLGHGPFPLGCRRRQGVEGQLRPSQAQQGQEHFPLQESFCEDYQTVDDAGGPGISGSARRSLPLVQPAFQVFRQGGKLRKPLLTRPARQYSGQMTAQAKRSAWTLKLDSGVAVWPRRPSPRGATGDGRVRERGRSRRQKGGRVRLMISRARPPFTM